MMKLQRKHVDSMQEWGKHQEPLFYGYNFPKMNRQERNYWYQIKAFSFSKRCYAIFNLEGQLVGYIALRDIKWFRKVGELGIVFDPDQINKGYGSDSLNTFLIYYFEVLKMKKLNLKVSYFNKRAQRCYEKCGFKIVTVKLEEFEDQRLPIFQEELYLPYRELFKLDKGLIKCQFIHMMMTKEMYKKNKLSTLSTEHLCI
ncbi:GCN5-related N-acetyltransferase [Alkaliphilus metalliredigens QYMF]|uniref:GCN5-related N-acetyltransferase n=2 Tax=Alkaliphilus TaxID=114627 RepID=A6TXB5_ALKMQ|nr:GCN5-related N-acetyltransferase [Alkaliphilus metalliredigens QYMF]